MVVRIPTGASRSSPTESILKVLSEIMPLSIERYKLAKHLETKFAIEIIYISRRIVLSRKIIELIFSA